MVPPVGLDAYLFDKAVDSAVKQTKTQRMRESLSSFRQQQESLETRDKVTDGYGSDEIAYKDTNFIYGGTSKLSARSIHGVRRSMEDITARELKSPQ